MFIRRIENTHPNTFSEEKLNKIHDVVYNKPYDFIPRHILDAIFKRSNDPQHINRFICSALVGYIYTQCNILHQNTDWSILLPEDFTSTSDTLLYISDTQLEEGMSLLK